MASQTTFYTFHLLRRHFNESYVNLFCHALPDINVLYSFLTYDASNSDNYSMFYATHKS